MGRGLFAGAKMAKDRQKFRWSDRRYKKRMLKSRAKHATREKIHELKALRDFATCSFAPSW